MTELERNAIIWRNGPDTGMSSIALVCYLMGWPIARGPFGDDRAYPHDPDDLGRCIRAVAAIGLRSKLDDAKAMGLKWAALIDHWSELTVLHGAWHISRSREDWYACYNRMRALMDVFCPRGDGELVWSSERDARCPACGYTVTGIRDPRVTPPTMPPLEPRRRKRKRAEMTIYIGSGEVTL